MLSVDRCVVRRKYIFIDSFDSYQVNLSVYSDLSSWTWTTPCLRVPYLCWARGWHSRRRCMLSNIARCSRKTENTVKRGKKSSYCEEKLAPGWNNIAPVIHHRKSNNTTHYTLRSRRAAAGSGRVRVCECGRHGVPHVRRQAILPINHPMALWERITIIINRSAPYYSPSISIFNLYQKQWLFFS